VERVALVGDTGNRPRPGVADRLRCLVDAAPEHVAHLLDERTHDAAADVDDVLAGRRLAVAPTLERVASRLPLALAALEPGERLVNLVVEQRLRLRRFGPDDGLDLGDAVAALRQRFGHTMRLDHLL
jgi:hypothetical protein